MKKSSDMLHDLKWEASASQWLNYHRRTLENYRQEYVAYNEENILAHGKALGKVLKEAHDTSERFAIYFVPAHRASITIYPIRLRSVSRHEWLPNHLIHLKHGEHELPAMMLIDSGADFSVISWQIGKDMGYTLADSEQSLLACGIGGTVEYVLRSIDMRIGEYSFPAPIAWLQEGDNEEMILGREVVFDRFNIEFRQAEEKIIFNWRTENQVV